MTLKDLKFSHLCLSTTALIFIALPLWQSSLLFVSSVLLVAFEMWSARSLDNRFTKMSAEIADLRNRVEAVQIGRTLGR